MPSTCGEFAAFIDQTLLSPTTGFVVAERWMREMAGRGFAALCVSPCFVPLARRICDEMEASAGAARADDLAATCGSAAAANAGDLAVTHVASVVGFPHGTALSSSKAAEACALVEAGCDEVDIVMNRGAFMEGDTAYVVGEFALIRDALLSASSHRIVTKVILETADLSDEQITEATRLLSHAGADFVKTSTGYAKRGASVHDVELMVAACEGTTGVKASGGIRDLDAALALIAAGATRLGTSHGGGLLAEFDRRYGDAADMPKRG